MLVVLRKSCRLSNIASLVTEYVNARINTKVVTRLPTFLVTATAKT
jgi:hypothetical protein